jgi:hypothetical protein
LVGLGWRRSCLFWVIIILASFAWLFKSTDTTLQKWSSYGEVQARLPEYPGQYYLKDPQRRQIAKWVC